MKLEKEQNPKTVRGKGQECEKVMVKLAHEKRQFVGEWGKGPERNMGCQ